jgi:hypothetical protein
LALSEDGVHYSNYALVMPGGFATPTVVYDAGVFHMWYLYIAPVTGRWTFGYATSPNGVSWTPWNAPPGCTGMACWQNHVLEPGVGTSPSCDFGGVSHPDVIKRGNEFWMYYQAQPRTVQYHDLMIRRAVSTDGAHWTKDPGAVLSTDAILSRWPECATSNPTPGSWVFWKRYGPAPSASAVTLLYRPSAVVVGSAMYLYFGGLNKVDYNDTHFSDRDIGVAFSTRFSDVLPTHWAYEAVEKVAVAGISSGCGNTNFCPDATITRKEAAAFIAQAANLPPNSADSLCDVPIDGYTPFIKAAYAAGVAESCGDCTPPDIRKRFCPDGTMNRLQLGVWVARALGLPGISQDNDMHDVTGPEKPLIEELHDAIGVACGTNLYCPGTPASRAMLAVMTADAFLP